MRHTHTPTYTEHRHTYVLRQTNTHTHTHHSVLRLLSSNTVHVLPPVTCVYLNGNKGKVYQEQSLAMPAGQDDIFYPISTPSVIQIHTVSLLPQLFLDRVLLSHYSFRETLVLNLL